MNVAVPLVPLAFRLVVPTKCPLPVDMNCAVIGAVEFDITLPNWSCTCTAAIGENTVAFCCGDEIGVSSAS